MSVPSAPFITSIDSGNESLTVIFNPPINDGGYPITNYFYSLDNGINYQYNMNNQSPIVITGLINGTQYEVVIKAVNAMGFGEKSNMVVGIPSA